VDRNDPFPLVPGIGGFEYIYQGSERERRAPQSRCSEVRDRYIFAADNGNEAESKLLSPPLGIYFREKFFLEIAKRILLLSNDFPMRSRPPNFRFLATRAVSSVPKPAGLAHL